MHGRPLPSLPSAPLVELQYITRSSWEAAVTSLPDSDREVALLLQKVADLDHDDRLSFQGRAWQKEQCREA